MATIPDLTIIHTGDAVDWDKYLTECFAQVTDPEPIHIHHERLDRLAFPLTIDQSHSLTSSKCVLVIISPDFLDFLDEHADVFELGKLFRPYQTLAILCGVQESDVTRFQKAALVSYDSWPRLVAQDQDENFVLAVIRVTRDILTRIEEVHTVQKPHFQLSPRKVKEGSNKVFLLMKKPVNDKQKIQVFLDVDGCKEVPVKRRNAYTFQFVVPENFLRYSRMINVHLRSDEGFLGVRQLKVESRMGELFSILSSVNSPYELLCETLGVAAYHEVDDILTKNFIRYSTEGLSLLAGNLGSNKKKSVEELPTLLHFAARYGLPKLMKTILQYPMAMPASRMRNVRGLTAAQLANSSGHNSIVLLLEEFEKTLESVKETCRLSESCNLARENNQPSKTHSPIDYENIAYANETYDKPLSTVVPVCRSTSDPKSPDYLPMSGAKPFCIDKLEPHQLVLLGLDDRPSDFEFNLKYRITGSVDAAARDSIAGDGQLPRHYPSGLCPSQKELLEILEDYKKGTSMPEVEKQFHLWQNKYKESSSQSTLSSLREAYKMIQKQQKPNKKQTFSLCELKQILFKVGKKGTHASSTNTLEKSTNERSSFQGEDPLQNIDGFRPVSTLSTASTASSSSSSSFDRCSAVSAGSTYDSGNHSDSCDETARLKENKSGGEESSHVPLGTRLSLSLRPPAPPPRPPKFVPKTAKKKNPKSETKSPDSHNYYNQREIRECSPEYIVPDSDMYVLASEVEGALTSTNGSSGGDQQMACKEISRRTFRSSNELGQGIYYDVPAPPLPVRSNSSSDESSPHRGLHQNEDYHVPKSPIRKVPLSENRLHYYAIPKFQGGTPPRLPVPRPTLSTVNIPLEFPSRKLCESPNEDRCNSIPTEQAPPIPDECEYDRVPLPRKYMPTL